MCHLNHILSSCTIVSFQQNHTGNLIKVAYFFAGIWHNFRVALTGKNHFYFATNKWYLIYYAFDKVSGCAEISIRIFPKSMFGCFRNQCPNVTEICTKNVILLLVAMVQPPLLCLFELFKKDERLFLSILLHEFYTTT